MKFSADQAAPRRSVVIDSIICVLMPTIYLGFYYVVEGHRFDIFEDIGCLPVFYNTIPTIFLIYMWPLVLGLISAVYCTLSMVAFIRRLNELDKLFASTPNMNTSRYLRLMGVACMGS